MAEKLLEVSDLRMYFDVNRGFAGKKVVKAVDGVSLDIGKGEVYGLVGESGCGKSTLGRAIVRIYHPSGGRILYEGEDIANKKGEALKSYRRQMQMIFQDPYASLNPRMTVGEIIREPMDIHNILQPGKQREERVRELLHIVGLRPGHIRRYPHEFSGRQRQRVGIARALALNPRFIVCDEPISALDVSIQAQIINLMEEIREKTNVSYLFIAHDLSMVKYISDRIGVMYLGNIVESGDSTELYRSPMHPYTQALLSAVPIPDPRAAKSKKRILLKGEIPSPINPPRGCKFSTRCPRATERCFEEAPPLKNVGSRKVACFLY